MNRVFTKIAGGIAAFAGQPLAFVIALLLIPVWGVSDPFFHHSDTWQLVVNTATTIITFLMVFLIQNSQNRDGAAMQAKLDELIRAIEPARGHVHRNRTSDGPADRGDPHGAGGRLPQEAGKL